MSFHESHTARHRSRLSHEDVKLILYLIVHIKPFKYVGDRTLSQSRKWDLIQQKLEQQKLRHHASFSVVPTVRTLQRQMATALRNAQKRQENEAAEPFVVFQNLSKNSPLEDLELAVLELYNLLEAYKTGQTMGALPDAARRVFEDERMDMDLPELDPTDDGEAYDPADEEAMPLTVAHILHEIRQAAEQNKALHSECMALLRMHAQAVNERCLRLEQMVLAMARNDRHIKKEYDELDTLDTTEAEPVPSTASSLTLAPAPLRSPLKEGQYKGLRLLLELLN